MNLLFTDLDGTLLNNASEISPAMLAALKNMLQKGHRLILSSGRPLASILEVKQKAGLTAPGILIIANNGALVYDCDAGRSLQRLCLSIKDVSALFSLADKHGIHIHTYLGDAVVTKYEDPETAFYTRRIHLPVLELKEKPVEQVLTQTPYKCLAVHLTDPQKLEALRQEAESFFQGRITSLYSNAFYLEFFDAKAGKGNAVRFVCDYLDAPLSNAYAAGDADNDISMLEAAGTGIAMANAGENVKKAAALVTGRDNDHDGLLEILETYFS